MIRLITLSTLVSLYFCNFFLSTLICVSPSIFLNIFVKINEYFFLNFAIVYAPFKTHQDPSEHRICSRSRIVAVFIFDFAFVFMSCDLSLFQMAVN